MENTINSLIEQNGIDLDDAIFIRHKDKRAEEGKSVFELWEKRFINDDFHTYLTIQGKNLESRLNTRYWIVFIGTEGSKTVFAGIYEVISSRILDRDVKIPTMGGYSRKNENLEYDVKLRPELGEYIGKMTVEWGRGYIAWIQKAKDNDKRIIGIA